MLSVEGRAAMSGLGFLSSRVNPHMFRLRAGKGLNVNRGMTWPGAFKTEKKDKEGSQGLCKE